MLADNGLMDGYETKLYFPCDPLQAAAVVETTFFQPGLRFVFTTRSKTPGERAVPVTPHKIHIHIYI